ncbi:VOC family protein [Nakamurella sp. A5-74]|uniref:VOC family protein n=1 Tax=Nakamurella sp. A5-74 TaxID=3158264 RepID=A0AAU8DTT2_9ACTN
MKALRVIPNIPVHDAAQAQEFFGEFLGLSNVEFDLGWVTRLTSPDSDSEVQLVTRDLTSPEDSVISVMTDDVDAAYAEAQTRGYDIVHPLTDEAWGVRRFLVRSPDGCVVNIVRHHT